MLLACYLLLTALRKPATRPLIIPHPKQTNWSDQVQSIHDVAIIYGNSRLDRAAAEAIEREVIVDGDETPTLQRWPPREKPFIAIGEPSERPWLGRLLSKDAREVPQNPEGYFLTTHRNGQAIAIVAGRTPQATLYGAQTLCQMFQKAQSGIAIQEATIRDWPSLSWRGVHLFLGNTALPFHKKLIANILSRYKLNHLLLQCEQVDWNTTHDAAPDWAMSKSDLAKEISFAHSFGLVVEPLVNSEGHMKWLLANPKYTHLAEDRQHPGAICPTDPETYPLLFRLYKEVIATFRTPVLHFGGDEVNLMHRYPWRSIKKYPRVADAFIAHTLRLSKWLKQRGIQPLLWDDMFFSRGEAIGNVNATSPEEALETRNAIPKNALVFDWYYGKDGNASRIAVLQKAGFHNIVGSTGTILQGIQSTCKALTNARCAGLLQTTWVGYDSQEKNMHSYPSTFSAFIVAADESWNGGTIPIDKLGYDPLAVLKASYRLPIGTWKSKP